VEGLSGLLSRLGEQDAVADDPARAAGHAAAAVELVLEGLYLTRRLSKDELPGRVVYGGA
jgi:magnesium chelatase subunit I